MPGYEIVTYGGVTLDRFTRNLLERALAAIGLPSVPLYQGSYHAGHGPSEGTHDDGGVFDVNTSGLTAPQKRSLLQALIDNGFAAWMRLASEGPWPEHIHAVALRNQRLSPQAQAQVQQWQAAHGGTQPGATNPAPTTPTPGEPPAGTSPEIWAGMSPEERTQWAALTPAQREQMQAALGSIGNFNPFGFLTEWVGDLLRGILGMFRTPALLAGVAIVGGGIALSMIAAGTWQFSRPEIIATPEAT